MPVLQRVNRQPCRFNRSSPPEIGPDAAAPAAAAHSRGPARNSWCAASTCSSSPACVLPAIQMGLESPSEERSEVPSNNSSGLDSRSNLILPMTRVLALCAPMAMKRAASSRGLRCNQRTGGKYSAKQVSEAPVAGDGLHRQARAGEHQGHAAARALAEQIRPQLGFHDDGEPRPDAVRNRSTARGRSKGRKRTSTASPNRSRARARPVAVAVVSTKGLCGCRARRARTRGAAADISPGSPHAARCWAKRRRAPARSARPGPANSRARAAPATAAS